MSKGFNTKKRPKPLPLKLLNHVMIIASFAFLSGFLIYLAVEAFQASFSVGMRSLCASILPPVVVTYLTYFVHRVHLSRNNYIPRINVYLLSTLWTLFIFFLFINLYNPEQLSSLPIVELLFTTTLVMLILAYRGLQYATALAASYGLVTGLLIFALTLPIFTS